MNDALNTNGVKNMEASKSPNSIIPFSLCEVQWVLINRSQSNYKLRVHRVIGGYIQNWNCFGKTAIRYKLTIKLLYGLIYDNMASKSPNPIIPFSPCEVQWLLINRSQPQ